MRRILSGVAIICVWLCAALLPAQAAVSTPEALHQVIRSNALQLRNTFSCSVPGGAMPLLPRSFWQDFAEFCVVRDMPGGKSSLDMVLKPSTRLLAAHYNPKLSSKLSAQERQALAIVQERIRLIIRPGMSDYDKVKAVHDDIINRASYDDRAHGNILTMILQNRGDCEGYAQLTQIMMTMAGLNCHTVCGRIRVAHTWNLIWVEGGWYHIDVAWDDPVTRSGAPVCRYTYFLINDSAMSRTHRWNREEVPASGPKRTLLR